MWHCLSVLQQYFEDEEMSDYEFPSSFVPLLFCETVNGMR